MKSVTVYVPFVMYGLRLFIAVLQEVSNCLHICMISNCLHICMISVRGLLSVHQVLLHTYYNVYGGVFIEMYGYAKFVFIGCCVSELHGHLRPYRNVWPEAVSCCYTRTTLFTRYLHNQRLLSLHQVSLLYTFWFLR